MPLLTALRECGLDDAGTLLNYPLDWEDKGECGVLSGATTTAHLSIVSSATSSVSIGPTSSGTGLLARAGGTGTGGVPKTDQASLSDRVVGACDVEKGGDPRTGQFVPSGGEENREVKTDHRGGDPRTGLFDPSGGEVKTDQHVPSRGEVKTDHNPFDVQMDFFVDETVDSPLPGELATQTAIPDPVSPALDSDLAVSRGLITKFLMDSRVLSRIQNFAMDCRAVSRIEKFATSFRGLKICRVKHILKD